MSSPKIVFDNLSYTYKRSNTPALQNISGEILPGESIVIMGGGGSGKSSLCYSLKGIIPHSFTGTYTGDVFVNGHSIAMHDVAHWSHLVGLVLQDFESQLFSSTLETEIAFGLENLGIARAEMDRRVAHYLNFIGLLGRRKNWIGALSGGQKQSLAIASILAMESEVLVMDEPTTDLDPLAQHYILSLTSKLREKGTTLVITDHRPETALDADKVWLLKDGRLVKTGKTREVMTNTDLLKECNVRPLAITELFQKLGYGANIWTVEEAENILRQRDPNLRARNSQHLYVSRISSQEPPIIEAQNLTYMYDTDPGAAPAIRNIDLKISRGEFVAIIGANGSGKTTLAKHFNLLLAPTSGRVYIVGKPIQSYTRAELAQVVGYVFQNPDHQIFASSVFEEVAFSLKQFRFPDNVIQQRVSQSLEAVGLRGYDLEDPVLLTKGQRQRVAVASALAARPSVLILDEPTKGLDYDSQLSLMQMLVNLNQDGHTIVFITHSLWLVAEYAKRVVVLNKGTLGQDGSTRHVFADEEHLREQGIKLPPLVELSNRLGMKSLFVEQMIQELKVK